jgi:hypothetical protein
MRAIAGQAGQALQRTRLYELERNARAAAEQASALKDQFVTLVSHELRNPLSAIQAGLYVLRHEVPRDGRAGRAMQVVERNIKLQARLVDDLLDLSHLTRGTFQLQRAPVALDEIVRTAIATHEPEARGAGVALTSELEEGLWVDGDSDRLQQVVTNLLGNAIKFTPPGGSVTASATGRGRPESGGVVQLTVADTGIGIAPSRLEQIFDLFHQGEGGHKTKSGLGVGLALVRGIAERHGGRVWAESGGDARGSRFILELPLLGSRGTRSHARGQLTS